MHHVNQTINHPATEMLLGVTEFSAVSIALLGGCVAITPATHGSTPSPTPSTPRTDGSRFTDLMDFLASDDSPVHRYTPENDDVDGVFNIRWIIQQFHLDVEWAEMHEFRRPRKGRYRLRDYEKAFTPVEGVDKDIFDCAISTAEPVTMPGMAACKSAPT